MSSNQESVSRMIFRCFIPSGAFAIICGEEIQKGIEAGSRVTFRVMGFILGAIFAAAVYAEIATRIVTEWVTDHLAPHMQKARTWLTAQLGSASASDWREI